MSAHETTPKVPTSSTSSSGSKKRRKNHHSSAYKTHTTLTISQPQYTYLHLSLVSSASLPAHGRSDTALSSRQKATELDALTVRTHLTAALSAFLGLTGSAIPVDILKHSGIVNGSNDAWIRVPFEDGNAVVAALGTWVGRGNRDEGGMLGWRILGTGNWLPGLVGGKDEAQKLFHNSEGNGDAG
ncbi:MAG: hypothetical protein M1821_003201 [Bathelium mastoideum]|nr:MAG: hypothetical protein M1821_003201 [Bathelium mastoideum]